MQSKIETQSVTFKARSVQFLEPPRTTQNHYCLNSIEMTENTGDRDKIQFYHLLTG